MKKHETHKIPQNAIDALARSLLPTIRSYFESEEGQREYAEWKSQQGTKFTTEGRETLPLAS